MNYTLEKVAGEIKMLKDGQRTMKLKLSEKYGGATLTLNYSELYSCF